jgi:hypothetical protein
MISTLENPKLWRDRAEEAHKIAEELSDPISREMMFTIAEDYLRLAEHAERRAKNRIFEMRRR